MQSPAVKLYKNVTILCRRNVGVFAPCLQKIDDPIQKLFLDKIREFKAKSGTGKLVEPSPELEAELKNDREKVLRQFGISPGEDVTKFPSFKFEDGEIESPSLQKASN